MSKAIYQTTMAKRKKVDAFFERYPSAFPAWLERQSSTAQHFWMLVKVQSIESLLYEFEGQTIKLPTAKELLHCWYRAALELVDERDSSEREITDEGLAEAFGLTRGVYQKLVKKEKAWRERPRLAEETMTLRRRHFSLTFRRSPHRHSLKWMLKRPDAEEIKSRLI